MMHTYYCKESFLERIPAIMKRKGIEICSSRAVSPELVEGKGLGRPPLMALRDETLGFDCYECDFCRDGERIEFSGFFEHEKDSFIFILTPSFSFNPFRFLAIRRLFRFVEKCLLESGEVERGGASVRRDKAKDSSEAQAEEE